MFRITGMLVLAMMAGMCIPDCVNAGELSNGRSGSQNQVEICEILCLGYFRVPGTTTCVHIFGQIRADYYLRSAQTRSDDTTNFRYQARMTFDGRTLTEYGVLQSLI